MELNEKTCSRCKETKSFSLFTKNGTATDGYYSMCKECKRDSQYFSTYGITQADYDLMLELQDSSCAICNVHEQKTTKKRLFVDHDHKTKKVRGLLCQHCNFVLGQARDDISILENAITYLQQHE